MLHSHSFQEKAFESFASFLRKFLSGDSRYQQLIEPVIVDAVLLAKKEIDYYHIKRDSIDVIMFLAEKDPNFFSGLNVQQLSEQEYKRILDMVTAPREVIPA